MKNIYLVNLNNNKSSIKFFSQTLIEKITSSLEKGKKIILYLNRRGEFSSLICLKCQKIYECERCNVSMKVHNTGELICHACGLSRYTPNTCDKCGSNELLKVGIGTQQIETGIKIFFKDKNVFRFDTDNIKNISQKKEALESLNKADIIIGTKMITTGFDFSGVGVVAVMMLEQELGIPDFRTEEKVYSNIKQVIGRGGRKGEETDIIIQTFIPDNPLVQTIVGDNYKDFMIKCLEERKMFGYPPFNEYAEIIIKNRKIETAEKLWKKTFDELKPYIGENIKAFKIPNYNLRNNIYIYRIGIKGQNIREALENIRKLILRNPNINIEFK